MYKLLLFLLLPVCIFAKEVNIAVVAISGVERSTQEWKPTVDYLQTVLPHHHFKLHSIEPHDIKRLKKLVKEEKIDFVITQPAIYVELELELGMSRILTMIKRNGFAEFGSVFITRQDSKLEEIEDIKGENVSAVAPLGFGGWLVGYNELMANGIDPVAEGLVSFEGTQLKVIKAVLEKKSSVGVIRTGMIEKLKANGYENIELLRVLNAQHLEGFPFALSTALYPEWALAKSHNTPNALSKEVATAFLSITQEMKAAQSAGYESWTFPYNYQPVHELMKNLRVGSYKEYGKMEPEEILFEYRYFFSIMSLIFILLISFLFYSRYMNNRLSREQALKNEALSQLETIFDIQDALLFVLKDNVITKANTAFLNFFRLGSLDEFLRYKKPIEEYFEDMDDVAYISFERYGDKWAQELLNNENGHYKVMIFNTPFAINMRKLPSQRNSYVVMLNDIGYMEDNKAFLESQIEIAKEHIVENERELYKKSKQAAMGEMISVIAHQLKQPLGIVSVIHNTILLEAELGEFSKEMVVEKLKTAGEHIGLLSSTIDDFRDFFKPNKVPKSFLLGHCVNSVLNLLRPILDERHITVVYEEEGDIEVLSLENELFHVIMNIVNNAKDVLTENSVEEPKIYINARKEEEHVLLSIEDNAGGIDENIIAKVFEQYFTTKEDAGTGLGLHMSKMIIEESLGGRLSVTNGNHGAKFSIIL
jgi:two-component system sensor histidine kinase TtrS